MILLDGTLSLRFVEINVLQHPDNSKGQRRFYTVSFCSMECFSVNSLPELSQRDSPKFNRSFKKRILRTIGTIGRRYFYNGFTRCSLTGHSGLTDGRNRHPSDPWMGQTVQHARSDRSLRSDRWEENRHPSDPWMGQTVRHARSDRSLRSDR